MKAMVYHSYGTPDMLSLEELRKPTPLANEVLIKVHAASVAAGDWHLLRGQPLLVRLMFGLFKPKHTILGADIAGRVEAVGSEVTQFRPGDEVFGDLSNSGFGAFAEYVSVPAAVVTRKPAELTWEQAAAVPVSAVTALQGLRDEGQIRPGHKVLINGASGGVGTFAVQLAKSFGAEVTGVCSTRKLDLVRSIGADHVIDYTQADFTASGQQYDLILDTAARRSIFDLKRALTRSGRYVMVGGPVTRLFQAMLLGPLISMRGEQKIGSMLAKPNIGDLDCMTELLEAGSVVPVIDRQYPLSKAAEALRYFGAGRATGKVVITMEHADAA